MQDTYNIQILSHTAGPCGYVPRKHSIWLSFVWLQEWPGTQRIDKNKETPLIETCRPAAECLAQTRTFGILVPLHLIGLHSQNTASAQLPQPTHSQMGKPEENEFRPQPHLVSLSPHRYKR